MVEVRRHHPEQILRPHHPVEQVDDRQRHAVTAGEVDVPRVEVEDEHAVLGIRGHLESVALRVGVAAIGQRRPFRVFDELDAIDDLRLAVFEQLEVVDGQPGHGFPVLGGVGVDRDEVRAGSERRRPLLIVLFLLRMDEETGGSQGQAQNGRHAAHRLSGGRWQRQL